MNESVTIGKESLRVVVLDGLPRDEWGFVCWSPGVDGRIRGVYISGARGGVRGQLVEREDGGFEAKVIDDE